VHLTGHESGDLGENIIDPDPERVASGGFVTSMIGPDIC
jgi:hypothetical protein